MVCKGEKKKKNRSLVCWRNLKKTGMILRIVGKGKQQNIGPGQNENMNSLQARVNTVFFLMEKKNIETF